VHDTLLFLHILCAFSLFAAITMYSAFVLGGPVSKRSLGIADVLSAVGGIGVLALGIWLAIYDTGVEVWDGWVLAAIVIWAAGFGLSSVSEAALKAEAGDEPAPVSIPSGKAIFHWVGATMFLLLLVVMIWKPGA
jgi:hypothetical protein